MACASKYRKRLTDEVVIWQLGAFKKQAEHLCKHRSKIFVQNGKIANVFQTRFNFFFTNRESKEEAFQRQGKRDNA